jgi:hypothetical protein
LNCSGATEISFVFSGIAWIVRLTELERASKDWFQWVQRISLDFRSTADHELLDQRPKCCFGGLSLNHR